MGRKKSYSFLVAQPLRGWGAEVRATKKKHFFSQQNPMATKLEGGGKALVAGKLKNYFFCGFIK